MTGTAAWLVLAGLALGWELVCRLSRGRLPTLPQWLALLASRLPGRLLLAVVWIFAGIHLFVRRSVPGL